MRHVFSSGSSRCALGDGTVAELDAGLRVRRSREDLLGAPQSSGGPSPWASPPRTAVPLFTRPRPTRPLGWRSRGSMFWGTLGGGPRDCKLGCPPAQVGT